MHISLSTNEARIWQFTRIKGLRSMRYDIVIVRLWQDHQPLHFPRKSHAAAKKAPVVNKLSRSPVPSRDKKEWSPSCSQTPLANGSLGADSWGPRGPTPPVSDWRRPQSTQQPQPTPTRRQGFPVALLLQRVWRPAICSTGGGR